MYNYLTFNCGPLEKTSSRKFCLMSFMFSWGHESIATSVCCQIQSNFGSVELLLLARSACVLWRLIMSMPVFPAQRLYKRNYVLPKLWVCSLNWMWWNRGKSTVDNASFFCICFTGCTQQQPKPCRFLLWEEYFNESNMKSNCFDVRKMSYYGTAQTHHGAFF